MSYDTDPSDVPNLRHALAQERERTRAMRAERDANHDALDRIRERLRAAAPETPESGDLVAGVLAKLAESAAEIRALRERAERAERFMAKETERYAGSVICGEVLGLLEKAGCGKPGTPNTLWAMVLEIISRLAAAERERDEAIGANLVNRNAVRLQTEKADAALAKVAELESSLARTLVAASDVMTERDSTLARLAAAEKSRDEWMRRYQEKSDDKADALQALAAAEKERDEARRCEARIGDAHVALLARAEKLRGALLCVSTDLAQDALEDPIGNAERAATGFYRIGRGARDVVRAVLADEGKDGE
jgi:hypothetical protein